MTMTWKGVMPAITTEFNEDLSINHEFVAAHCRRMIDAGCTGIVAPGSLGEGNTLTFDERVALWQTIVKAVGERVPIVAAISALSTAEAVKQAKTAADNGCKGLMVLPPYVYKGDWREMKYHVDTTMSATNLSCMLYNNPVAYGTDFFPEQIQELAGEHENFHSVKESSTDVRRVTAIRALIGNRLEVFVGVDDAIVEGIAVGATGWIAGLVNAFPKESVDLFNYAIKGDSEKAMALYSWFLPMLRMDTVPKFVQLIKLAQAETGLGNARVRPPRMEVVGKELEEARAVIQQALANRPNLD
jgi:4-hydroxy-tetrahydrodipicolinate synthase